MNEPAAAPPRDLGDHAERVRSKGQEEAQRILATARAEAEEIVRKGQTEVRALLDKTRDEAENEAKMLEQHELSSVELESKRKGLLAQKAILDQVSNLALQRLAELPEEKRRTLVGALLVKAKKDVPSGGAFAHDHDRAQVEAAGYRYLGPFNAKGGILVESSDGRFRVDLRFETILQETWGRSVKDVVNALNQ